MYSSSAANIDVYEVDINGTFATPTPTPTNTDSSLFVINGLDKVVDSSTSLTLNWSPINSVYLKHYKVYQDNVLIGTVNTNFLSVSGLTAGQTYEFKVTPVDTFDMEFAPGTLSYTVPIPDTTPPGIPKNIKVVPDRYNAAVSWAGPSDPDLLGYYIYLDDMRVNPSPIQTASHNLTGLKPDTDYQIRVAAVDTSGNISEQSPAVTFKTLALQAAPLRRRISVPCRFIRALISLGCRQHPPNNTLFIWMIRNCLGQTRPMRRCPIYQTVRSMILRCPPLTV